MAAKAKKTEATTETAIRAVKGFDKDLKCRGFQFEVGKTYEQAGDIEVCHNGFHAVTGSPFDAWNHYPIVADDGSLNRWAEVTLSGKTSAKSEENDSKIAAAKITVDVELNLPDFIRRAVAWVVDATKGKGDNPSGNYARIGSSGDYAQIGSSGYYAQIKVEGKDAVVASAGKGTAVSGVDGTWISLAEYDRNGKCIGFATGCIGRDGLTAGVQYIAKGGKLVPAS